MSYNSQIKNIVYSSDFNPNFLNFWPIVSMSCQKIFGIKPDLALVYRPSEQHLLEAKRGKILLYGNLFEYVANSTAPIPNQAKLARFYLASKLNSSLCMIDDIDTVHLKSDHIYNYLDHYDSGKLLGIGSEVYLGTSEEGKFPIGNFMGSSKLIGELFDVAGETFSEYIDKFKNCKIIDTKEDPFLGPDLFSDESLIRALIRKNNFVHKILVIQRGIDVKKFHLDRSWWPYKFILKKRINQYITVNFPRPLYENFSRCEIIIKLFFENKNFEWILLNNEYITTVIKEPEFE